MSRCHASSLRGGSNRADRFDSSDSTDTILQWEPAPDGPSYEKIRERHYRGTPSFEDKGVVDVKSFGALGDGSTDDTEAFRKAIAASEKVFLPNGKYKLSGSLQLGLNTHLFGLSPVFSSLGTVTAQGGRRPRPPQQDSFTITTVDDNGARPGLSFLAVQGRVHWKSGQSTCMLAPTVFTISGNGGGRFYGVMARGGPLMLSGIESPTSFYALNVERKSTNPQSEFRDSAHVRVYYFQVEAGTVNRPNGGDANTPCRLADCRDMRVYCMTGVVRGLESRPMLEVVESTNVLVSQLKTFSPGSFPHLVEVSGGNKYVIPSSEPCALFVRGPSGTGPGE